MPEEYLQAALRSKRPATRSAGASALALGVKARGPRLRFPFGAHPPPPGGKPRLLRPYARCEPQDQWQQMDTTLCMRVLLDPENDASQPLDLLGNTAHPGAARRACNAVRTARNEAAHASDRSSGAGRPSSLTRRWSAWRTPTPARLSAKRSWPSTTSSPGTICAGAAWAAKNRLRPPIRRPPLGKRQAGTKRPAAPRPKYISTPLARPARRLPQPGRKRSGRRAPGRERSRHQKPPAAPLPAGAGLRPEGARPANQRRTQSPKDAVPAGESRRAAARP